MVAGREPKNINEQQIYIIFTAIGTLFFPNDEKLKTSTKTIHPL